MEKSKYRIIRIMSDLELPSWRLFLNKQKNSSFFHSPEYFNALAKCNSIEPIGIIVVNNVNEIVGLAIGEKSDEFSILPYISRRTIFYDAPLYSDLFALKMILDYLSKCNCGIFIQIRNFYPLDYETLQIYKQYGYNYVDHLNCYILLENDLEIIFKNFKKDKQKGIIKAEQKYKIKIMEFDDIKHAVELFYSFQKSLFKKKRHAYKSKEYFYNLASVAKQYVHIAFAVHDGQPIAVQLYIVYGNRITAFYTSTLSNYRNLHAGDLLVWYMIKKGKQMGLKVFDFGGGGNPHKSYSPRFYKERFNPIFENVGRLTMPKSPFYKIAIFLYDLILKK